MSHYKTIFYTRRVFDVGEFAAAFAQISKALSPDFTYKATVSRDNPDGSHSSDDSETALQHLCKFKDPDASVYARFGKKPYTMVLVEAGVRLGAHETYVSARRRPDCGWVRPHRQVPADDLTRRSRGL